MEIVYPGTFDPITRGHIDILNRALKVFNSITILVLENKNKKTLFNIEERVNMIKEIFNNNDKIKVKSYNGLLVNYLNNNNVRIVIRGLRAISDFEYEFQMAMTNRKLCNDYDVMFFVTDMQYIYLSSSIVKELAMYNADISCMVTNNVEKKLKEKLNVL